MKPEDGDLVSEDADSLLRETEEKIEGHEKAMVESYKLEFEIHKTQATLVTGSLVAVIALSDLLIPERPRYTLLLAVSCVLLLFSMGWSLAAMLRLTTAVMIALSPWSSRETKEKQRRGIKGSRWVSLVSFPLGIGVFALYVYLNRFF